MSGKRAILGLEDGTYFIGRSFGAEGETEGELIFNTSMTGYQEILTDPSYRGQIVVMTYTQIGNYGINDEDFESPSIHVRGFVVREAFGFYSNWRAKKSLHEFLKEHGIVGIEGIDTRALVKRIRDKGVVRGVISTEETDPLKVINKAKSIPSISELDLVREVVPERYDIPSTQVGEGPLIGIVDFGYKKNIERKLRDYGADVVVIPYFKAFELIEKLKPDALLMSNGPGDPERVKEGIEIVNRYAGKVPIFGICLGHQIIGIALGCRTYKLKFGHHGGNHPVKNLLTGSIEITAQNHNYAIDPDSIGNDIEITHINLLDDTVEGIRHKALPIYSVQFHPENSPGPHDSYHIFKEFMDITLKWKKAYV